MDLTFAAAIAFNDNFDDPRPLAYLPFSLLMFGVLVLLIE
jgi:hypothetical protein